VEVLKRKKKNKIILLPHQGLGDLILCLGLFRFFEEEFQTVKILVRRPYQKDMRRAFASSASVVIISLPRLVNEWELPLAYLFGKFLQLFNYTFLPLGYLGKEFLSAAGTSRFDENFYQQANQPFSHRWELFRVERDPSREKQLFDALGCSDGPYVFVHQSQSRGFTIQTDGLERHWRVIEPRPEWENFSIWDYIPVLEKASQIHAIESSFAALADGLSLTCPKFAHRYARPEASGDWKHEFTYGSPWNVLESRGDWEEESAK